MDPSRADATGTVCHPPRDSLPRRLFLHGSAAGGSAPTTGVWLVNFALILGLGAGLFTYTFQQLEYHWNWSAPWRYRAVLWKGWYTTVAIAAASLALSTALGVSAALAGRSRLLPLRALTTTYVELVRGTPLLVQILVIFYVIAPAFRLENRFVAGVLILSLFAGAYITEIIRGGIDAIGATQWETARSLGLTTYQTYRWVVLPQAVRHILPALAGQFVSLIKDSSLLSVISIGEFALSAQQVNSLTFGTLESYLPMALGYLVLTLPISLWTRHLERRTHFET